MWAGRRSHTGDVGGSPAARRGSGEQTGMAASQSRSAGRLPSDDGQYPANGTDRHPAPSVRSDGAQQTRPAPESSHRRHQQRRHTGRYCEPPTRPRHTTAPADSMTPTADRSSGDRGAGSSARGQPFVPSGAARGPSTTGHHEPPDSRPAESLPRPGAVIRCKPVVLDAGRVPNTSRVIPSGCGGVIPC